MAIFDSSGNERGLIRMLFISGHRRAASARNGHPLQQHSDAGRRPRWPAGDGGRLRGPGQELGQTR